jgi:ribosomal 50S subunit-recycling heat shock protein
MRIDKFLKESRIIKRRVLAKEATDNGHIYINQKQVKPSDTVSIGDVLEIKFAKKTLKVKITSIKPLKGEDMFEVIEESMRH